eukprot:TRINITY_DN5936_c0_g1_i4.p1 TRINITY_DN5936_c0_g1~~TRINITY_DN5936_c0_g1_i4.p1  ORF type:complete len:252 (-),score=29.91 TRINITY_DN5936_c0_g1_i4:610-1365(-)
MFPYVADHFRPHHKTTPFDRFYSFTILFASLSTILSLVGVNLKPNFVPSSDFFWLLWWFSLGFSAFYYPVWMKHLRWPSPDPHRKRIIGSLLLSLGVGLFIVWMVRRESPLAAFFLVGSIGCFSLVLGSALDKLDKRKWQDICFKNGQKLPWEHWAWDWAERQRNTLVRHIAEKNLNTLSSVTEEVLFLLHFSHVENDVVVWNQGEGWRGVIEWARHEKIEANISAFNRDYARLLVVAEQIAQKYCPVLGG